MWCFLEASFCYCFFLKCAYFFLILFLLMLNFVTVGLFFCLIVFNSSRFDTLSVCLGWILLNPLYFYCFSLTLFSVAVFGSWLAALLAWFIFPFPYPSFLLFLLGSLCHLLHLYLLMLIFLPLLLHLLSVISKLHVIRSVISVILVLLNSVGPLQFHHIPLLFHHLLLMGVNLIICHLIYICK